MSNSEVRVVTWNVRHGRGRDGRVDLERVARVLSPLQAEVIALQELDVGRARSGHADQPSRLAELLGMHATFFGTVEDHDGGRYGHAVFTRGQPDHAASVALPRIPFREPRGAIDVDVQTAIGPLRAIGVHLGLIEVERLRQVRTLTAMASGPRPAVLLGDFNAGARQPTMLALRRRFRDAAKSRAQATWPARLPLRRLDYVLLRGAIQARSSRVLRDGEAGIASDHLPLVVELAH